jgi:Helicase conserved C-terminal domain/PLD-like domain/SNF2-related domain
VPLSSRPSVVDNQQVPHGEALRYLLTDTPAHHALSVGTGYVTLDGLHLLAESVSGDRAVRLLLGAAPRPGLDAEPPTQRFVDQLAALRGDRDYSRFPPSRAAARLAQVDDFLARNSVEVRRYTTQFLHGKAYLLGNADDGRAALVSSANLTGPGMWSNRELGLADYNPPVVGAAISWFDRLWDTATDYKSDLRALLFPRPPFVTPEDVYLRALLELYGEELFTTEVPRPLDRHIDLAEFQRDGYLRARQIIARWGGVLYADGVGTGKTAVGLALIEEYALRQGVHALVVTPAQLRGMWRRVIDQARLPAQVMSYQELVSDEQLADPGQHDVRRNLNVAKDSYRLVVVDEAHALRNADNTWYRAMSRLLGGQPKDVVLLTATPINNTLWDLYNLVMLFARHDRALVAAGIDSIRGLFMAAGANARNAELLDPDRLFPLADAVSVRRDRSFIVANYPDAVFPDGTPVRFPTPILRTRRYSIDDVWPGLVSRVSTAIGLLSMARYRPSAYERAASEDASETNLAGLLQSAVLKRFESCWAACLATVRRMLSAHEAFLAGWDGGIVPSLKALREAAIREAETADVAQWLVELGNDDGSRSVDDFHPRYRDAVAADLTLLRDIETALDQLTPSDDPKLALLAQTLAETDVKVCVFASYAETVRYLDAHLDLALGVARDRITVIGSETTPDERTRMLSRFAPTSVVEPGYIPPEGEVDLLLSTDVLSEGQNLQQAGAVVSYDMPWNPQRVVQRNGRVIRLLSPHDTVRLTTMLPEPGELDSLLQLEARIQTKITAAGVFGLESGVLEDVEALARNYHELTELAERLVHDDVTLLEEGEDTGGSFAGEQLRALLLRAAAEGEVARLRELPWGIGTAFRQGPGVPSRGPAGVFFACRSRTDPPQRYWRYVRDDEVDREDLPMLRRIAPGNTSGIELAENLEAAWQVAVSDIVRDHNLRADPASAEQQLPASQRFALSALRDPAVALPAGAEDADELLSVPRGGAVRAALAKVQRAVSAREFSRDQAAERIVAVVQEFGLTPVPPPPPLEPITEDDVGVVCWMRILPGDQHGDAR